MRGNTSFANHFESCVRRRALLSVSMHPQCGTNAELAINTAWNRCFADTAPFDEHP